MSQLIGNTLEFIGTDEQVKQVREFLAGKPAKDGSETYIDFNNLIRMPEEFCLSYENDDSETFDKASDWALENWGTRLNAGKSKLLAENCIDFITLNYGIPHLIKKLSIIFPKIKFIYLWFDCGEDWAIVLTNGEGCYFDSVDEYMTYYPYLTGELDKHDLDDDLDDSFPFIEEME